MTTPTFEQTYVKYPFAPLVALAIKLSRFLTDNKDQNKNLDVTSGMPHTA